MQVYGYYMFEVFEVSNLTFKCLNYFSLCHDSGKKTNSWETWMRLKNQKPWNAYILSHSHKFLQKSIKIRAEAQMCYCSTRH